MSEPTTSRPTPGFNTPIPAKIMTPDMVETRISCAPNAAAAAGREAGESLRAQAPHLVTG